MMKNLYKALYGFWVETEKKVALWGVVLVSGACVKNVKEYVWQAFCLEMDLQNTAFDVPKHYVWSCQTHCLRRSNIVFDNFNTCLYRAEALRLGLSDWTSGGCKLHAKNGHFLHLRFPKRLLKALTGAFFDKKSLQTVLHAMPAARLRAYLTGTCNTQWLTRCFALCLSRLATSPLFRRLALCQAQVLLTDFIIYFFF